MNIEEFRSFLFSYARSKNLDDFEVYIKKSESQSISCLNKEIKNYSIDISINVHFKCIKDFREGVASTTFLDEDEAKRLVDIAVKNSEFEIKNENNSIIEITENINDQKESVLYEYTDIENIVKQTEKYALEQSELINVHVCKLNQIFCEISISNSKGFRKNRTFANTYLIIGCKVKDENSSYTFYDYSYNSDIKKLNYKETAERAVKNTIMQIGSQNLESKKADIIIKNDVFIDILKAFENIFSVEDAENFISLLKNKEDEKIASDCVTLIDCGKTNFSDYEVNFDDEANEIKYKKIIESGVFKTFLYNNEWAKKFGKKSTGNGFKESAKSKTKIKPCILFLQNGEKSMEEMIKQMNEGVLITQLSGLHSGTNKNTGEFSLDSKGFLVQNGKISNPIKGFTISGNFYDLLKKISNVGNDLKFDIPSDNGQYGSPSVLINDILIAGI